MHHIVTKERRGYGMKLEIGVDIYTLLMHESVLSRSVVSNSLRPHGLQPARLLCPRDFPDKNTGLGCISFSRGSSQPRDQTISLALAGGFFTAELPGKPHTIDTMYKIDN